ncbi:hypothetical protein DES53_107342 [Roseimicrobium gellanilyticum]|uniref:PDZ domain-containing protein n=2 Tax=Roseimicrobium gellanilyticum TaxID=748857 RepID=A0A366HIS8_9BACT|nr:hypothetical protein DES53_107342 [Roseimicrobium gellanilyticum]
MFSVAGTTHSQTQTTALPPSAPAAPSAFPAEELAEMMTYRHLGPGSMASAANSLEEYYLEKYTKEGQDRDVFPKLIYGPGAEDAKINGELKLCLYNTRALDALALVAAAAGCRLEPIPALPDGSEDKKGPQRVIGYYVSTAMRLPEAQAPEIKPALKSLPRNVIGTVGLTLGEQNGDILIRDVVPGLPAAQSRAIVPGEKLLSIAEEGATEVRAAEVGQEKVSELLAGEPGSKVRVTVAPPHGDGQPKVVILTRQPGPPPMVPPPLVKVVEPVLDTFAYVTTDVRPHPFIPGHDPNSPVFRHNLTNLAGAAPATPDMPAASPPPTGPLVRIYSVADIMKGDESQVPAWQTDLEKLVMESLEHASLLSGERPVLSLHRNTRVLIVKASAQQHEIIQQIITVLKENEAASAKDPGALQR